MQLLYLSTIAGLATPVGCLIVLLLGQPSEKLFAGLLAGAGGVMLAVISLDLIPAALSYHQPFQFLLGLAAGIIFMYLSEKILQRRYQSAQANRRTRLKMVGLLIASGIALHDIPEGMAIAVGQEATGQLGMIIAVGITLHNLPEGMATATPLLMAGIRKTKILALNLIIAFFTPLGAILGKLAISAVQNSLCLLLSLAAGAMAFLVLTELIPLAKENHPRQALLGGLSGYIFFVLLSLFM
ncbi:MAG: ZIP family metal transporter [Peptococcaceae bacterium]|jgi:ZIP family zinc transporter|nr:ZIP family metal transporter [Peptococcaceae bacterium]